MHTHFLWTLALTLTLSADAVAEPREPADLIINGDYVLTMEEGEAPLKNAAVVIRDDRIIDVLPSNEAQTRYNASQVIPGKNRVVMPGLINGHTHTAMTLFRGMVDDLDLMTWLNDYVFPMERQFVTPEFVRIGSELACWEMIRGGTTTFVDMYFYPDEIAGVVDRCGLRAVVGAPHIDFPSPGFEGWDDSFAAAREFVDHWQDRHSRIRPAFAPHAPYSVSAEHLAATVDAAADVDALVSMHLSEGPAEVAQIQSTYGKTPVNHVADLGLFEQKLIAAHMVVLTEEDIQRVASAGVGTVHNPTSNLKVASGVSPVPDLLAAGVSVALGTDGAASNNDLDLWEEVRLAALLHKGATGDPTAIPAQTALALATRIGARAIHWDDEIGTLAPGMQADLIQIEYGDTNQLPLYDIVSHLVYVLDSEDVTTTVVAGQILMQDKQILTINESALRKSVTDMAGRIRAELSKAP
ncbi:MAG: amidohydrolase family protein [Pseudomonadaceae bacterium]|nr:amidohydrolase family protein [Pseudomonadaceae bacterium]